jgi:hypothetical protein
MKGPRRLCQRGPSTGAVEVAKGSWHSGVGGDEGAPTAAACTPVASLMAIWQRQCARETKIGK